MDDRVQRRLLELEKRRRPQALREMIGTVTDDAPFKVTIRGVERADVVYLGGYVPAIGDRVVCIQKNQEPPIVLGRLGGSGDPVSAWQVIRTIELFGHSGIYGGASDDNRGTDQRLAALLGADTYNRSKGGARLSWHEPSSGEHGGWAHVYRYLAPSITEAPYLPNRDVVVLWFGENDLPTLGPNADNLQPFLNALEACISRARAGTIREENHASVTYPTGSWTRTGAGVVSGAGNLLYASGGYYQYASSGSIQIAVPADFPGGTVALSFIAGANGEGAALSFTVDGNSAGTLDYRDQNAHDYGTSNTSGTNRYATPAVKRLTELSAKAHTIVATTTSVEAACIFDCWWLEAAPPPIVIVPGGWQTDTEVPLFQFFDLGGFPYVPTAGDLSMLNTYMALVCDGFDDDVIFIDVDPILGRHPNNFTGDHIHPSDNGHALVATEIATQVRNRVRSRLAHAQGSGTPGFVSLGPVDTDRNVIEAQSYDAVPLTLRGRKPGDQLYALLRLDGSGSVAALEMARNQSVQTDARIGVAAAANQILTGSAAGDLVIRGDGGKVLLTGGTTVVASVDGTAITTVDPTSAQHVATKNYVDHNLGTWFAVPNMGNQSTPTPTANRVYYAQIVVPVPATLTGVYFLMVTIGSGVNVRSALYNAAGTRVANRTSNLACSALTFHKVAFDSAYSALPGVYFLALVFGAAQGTYAATNAISPCGYVAGPGSGATATSITPPTVADQTIPTMTSY